MDEPDDKGGDQMKWLKRNPQPVGVDVVATGVPHPGPLVLRTRDGVKNMNGAGLAELLRQQRQGRERVAKLLARIDEEIAYVEQVASDYQDQSR